VYYFFPQIPQTQLTCLSMRRIQSITRCCQRTLATSIAVPALGTTPKTATGAIKLYDEWAGSYDAALSSWGYPAPARVAALLASHGCVASSRILDLGCGTGMGGEALRVAGLGADIVGTDISTASLDLARAKGVYADLVPANLEEPLPFASSSFDAIVCVGVLSYVERFDLLLPELARVLRPGGVFATTHRTELWDGDSRGCRTAADALVRQGVWAIESIGEAEPYMPENPDPAESAKTIRLLAFRRA